MDVFFPVIWAFGDNPSDGVGGPPVEDGGSVFITRDEENPDDWPTDDAEIVVTKTTLSKMVAESIDGCVGQDGVIADGHIEACCRLRDALFAAAKLIDVALPSVKIRG